MKTLHHEVKGRQWRVEKTKRRLGTIRRVLFSNPVPIRLQPSGLARSNMDDLASETGEVL